MHLTNAEVKSVRDAVKRVDPARLVMVSEGPGGGSTRGCAGASLDIIAFHEEQGPHAYEKTAGPRHGDEGVGTAGVLCRKVRVRRSPATATRSYVRTGGCRRSESVLRRSRGLRRSAGAAAWTFHTDAGFLLDKQSFQQEIAACPREADFHQRLSAELKRP
jgi:hypothetical protein